jgi:hypothetical protein
MRRILIILAAALLVASCVRPPSVPSEPSIDVLDFIIGDASPGRGWAISTNIR